MSVFNYLDYRSYLKDTLKAKPKQGYGELSKWAQSCQIHPTLMSLILKSERDLSTEQAFLLGKHLGLTQLELDFFVTLIQYARAGTQDFREHISKKLAALKDEAIQVKKRFQNASEMTDEAKMIFYSSYIYSAIRLCCDTKKEGLTAEELAEKLQLQRTDVMSKLEFLLQTGLVQENSGHFQMGPSRTIVSRDSIYVVKHHQNWRTQAILKAEKLSPSELMFTCPMALSNEDFLKFKQEITDLIQKFSVMLKDSKSENVGCFNVDWFWVK